MAKFRPNHLAWPANQFPNHINVRKEKYIWKEKYLLFLSFAYLLMHMHTVYFFLTYAHAQGLCLKGKKILFFLMHTHTHTHTIYSFLSLLCTHTGFLYALLERLLPPLSMPPAP